MKRFLKRAMSRIGKNKLALVAVLALCAVTVPVAISMASPAPDRPTKVYSDGAAGFDHPTFDSFTNVPNIGNEENFFNGMYPGGSAYTDPMPQVKDGDVVTLEVYVHNGADPSLNDNAGQTGIARNTSVRVNLPSSIAKTQEATAYISSSNATPGTVSDTLDFGAANGGNFGLNYVPGSAKIAGNYIHASLPDSVVTTGATIGTDALDGNVKGCFQQMVIVTIQVKVNMPEYSLTKQVRLQGQTSNDWAKTDAAKPGSDVQWLLTFNDNGHTALNGVDVVDQVPAGLTVVPGSVKLTNGNYPNGYTYPDTAIQDNGRQINVNIGNYNPGIIGYITYDTTVDKLASTVCTPQTLTNKAFATPQGFGAIYDTATVTVPGNECTTTTPSYACNAFHVTVGDNRTVTVDQFNQSTSGGATFNDVSVDWGDKTTPLLTNTAIGKTHQYVSDGTYKLAATVHFTVNGKDQTSTGNCVQTVSFTTPGTPTQTPPTTLVNTGPGQVVGLFAGVSAIGAFAYRTYLRRKLAR